MLVRQLNIWISKWKGQPYAIDERLPVSYLLRLSLSRSFMICNGLLCGVRNGGMFFISPGATVRVKSKFSVGRTVTVERGAYIDALSENGIVFGNNVSVGRYTRIEGTGNLSVLGKGMVVGNNVGLGSNCFYGCAGGIEIGDDTIIGNFVSLHSENHLVGDRHTPIRLQGVSHKGIRIGKNCWVGAKATILDGAVIEEGCVIAAGAVVKSGSYPANGVYGGVPAIWLKSRIEDQNDKAKP
jgi:acetyltransferase-like isoleucine patch superfamily enzyme